MRRKLRVLTAIWICLLFAAWGLLPVKAQAAEEAVAIEVPVQGALYEKMTREVLAAVNAERDAKGIKPLAMTSLQEKMAEQRAVELTALFDHKRPDGSDCTAIAAANNLTYDAIGENIAAGQKDATEVMEAWMNSEEHKANILNEKFTHIGIGCFEYSGQFYWVQIFTQNPFDTTSAAEEGKDDIGTSASYRIICEHEEEHRIIDRKAATCTEEGYEKVTCSRCNTVLSEQPLAVLGHDFSGEEKVIQEATCVTEGTKEIACGNEGCDIVMTETIPVVPHSYGDWQMTKAATCTEKGEETHTCSVCGETETREIELAEHSLTKGETIKEATCTATGLEKWICTECGYTEERTTEATGHDFTGAVAITEEATCIKAGKQTIACVNANCKEVKTETIPLAAHTPEEVITEATCTEPGQKLTVCSVCQEQLDVEVIPATGHSFGEWKVTKVAAWNTEGTKERTCADCGEKETAILPVLSANHEHVYNGAETIVKQATCTEEGSKTIACGTPECDAKITVSILPTGHYEGKWETTTKATCTRVGRSVQRCSRCDAVIAEKAIAMKAHNYGEWEVVKKATTSAEGKKQRVCKACGHADTAVIKKLPAETEKKTTKTSNNTKKTTSTNNVKTGDSMQPLYYIIGLAGAGAVISLILYRVMRKKER